MSVRLPGSSGVNQIGNAAVRFCQPGGAAADRRQSLCRVQRQRLAAVGQPGLNGLGVVMQGYVESSNVNVVEELVDMIETQRAYEMNSRAISTTDQMLQYVSNNL